MRTALLSSAALLLSTVLATAQLATPFDMSPERKDLPANVPPASSAPAREPLAQSTPVEPAQQPQPPAPVAAAPVNRDAATGDGYRRYLIPAETMTLSGEIDRRSWSVTLTESEAQNARTLNLAYQNAIVIAPELAVSPISRRDPAVVPIASCRFELYPLTNPSYS